MQIKFPVSKFLTQKTTKDKVLWPRGVCAGKQAYSGGCLVFVLLTAEERV